MISGVSFIDRSKIRKQVLEALNLPKTPTKLSKELNTHRPSVSRAILQLEERKLVKCLNPNDRMGRFYQITNKGKKLLKEYSKFI